MNETQQYQYTPQAEFTSAPTTFQEQRDQAVSYVPRQIFREHALRHYMQKNEQSVLPKTISPFVFTCCWIVLCLTILAGFLIWSIPVPNYLNTLGMPIAQGSSASTTQTTTILAFFPLSAQAYIRSGQIVQIGGSTLESAVAGRITHVDTQHYNATELVKSYNLSPALVQFLSGSEVFTGTIMSAQPIPLQNDTSGRVIVHYQQGTREALSLLLDLRNP
jgi:hypothetical protein